MATGFTGRVRYSNWDGSQQFRRMSAEQVLEAISDDLIEYGDLQQALRNFLQRGTNQSGKPVAGLRELLKQVRGKRQSQLDRFDLDTVLNKIRQQLDEIIQLEKTTIQDWMGGDDQVDHPSAGLQPPSDSQPTNEVQGKEEWQADQQDPANQAPAPGKDHGFKTDADSFSERMLAGIGRRKQQFMEALPQDVAGQVASLKKYDFLSPEAQRRFLALLRELGRNLTNTFFRNTEELVKQISDGDIQRMKEMLRALNKLLVNRISGQDPGFTEFMQAFGDLFGDQPPESLDELLKQIQQQMAASQALLDSLSQEQRAELAALLNERFGDDGFRSELLRLFKALDFLDQEKHYRFAGQEPIELQAAMELMRHLAALDSLEQQLQQAQYDGNPDAVNPELLRELLGDEAAQALEEMDQLLKLLAKAGYVRRAGDKLELTPGGTRVLERKLLAEIYRNLKKAGSGDHMTPEAGRFGDSIEDTRPYEYGDPFHLHMPRTLRNALEREGPGRPIRLQPEDFEVHRTEEITRTATVLMLDLSWSMALRGAFQSAKKVALALRSLINGSYPRDKLYLLGFSAYAREIKGQDLPYLQYDDYLLGTNMQHALILAQKLLAKHPQSRKQIIMITDGEPTAHLEQGRPVFAYPPTATTLSNTLKAARLCTRKKITINTFMLDESAYLNAFIQEMHRINSGRVFRTTPGQLGEYLLTDYVQHKRRRLGTGSGRP